MQHPDFPRQTGHCAVFRIPESEVTYDNEEEDSIVPEEARQRGLIYLQSIGEKLVYGDLVMFEAHAGYRNDGIAIFDGEKIIDLCVDYDDYGSLPPQFHVIEKNVPLNYWASGEVDGITHNYIVWFDHRTVRDECMRNVTCHPDRYLDDDHESDPMDVFATQFTYEGRQYNLIFDHLDLEDDSTDRAKIQERFLKFLERDFLVFQFDNEEYPYLDNNFPTLYLATNRWYYEDL